MVVVVISIVVVVIVVLFRCPCCEATARTAKAADKQFASLRLGVRLRPLWAWPTLTSIRFMNSVLTASVQPENANHSQAVYSEDTEKTKTKEKHMNSAVITGKTEKFPTHFSINLFV